MTSLPPRCMAPLVRQSRPASKPSITILRHNARVQSTSAATTADISTFAETPRWPTIPICPPPLCPCAATPSDLDIRRDDTMTLPPYKRHVVIRTGRNDWASRIEDEESSVLGDAQDGKPRANLARSLKNLLRPGGKYYSVGEHSRARVSHGRSKTKQEVISLADNGMLSKALQKHTHY